MGSREQPAEPGVGTWRGSSRWWWVAVALGIALRIAIVTIPGNHLYSPWSGGGDTPSYVLLARNLLSGRGFTYASIPTAFRPPLYPILLAGAMWSFGAHWVLALRWLQFLLGLGTVFFAYRISRSLFGTEGGKAGLLICLFFPTLVYITSEVLTECLAGFFVAWFLLYMFRQVREADSGSAAGLGVTTSLAGLTRFNLAALIAPAAWAVLVKVGQTRRVRRLMLVSLLSLAVVSPWMVRNWIVFGDRLVFGTTSGYAALQGVLSPSGRAQSPETRQEKISGWLSYQLETNSPVRLTLPSELQLERRDWRITFRLWREEGWQMLPILGRKLSYYWLSTDQLFATSHFGVWTRIGRAGGVLAYWMALLLAVFGWLALWKSHPAVAKLIAFYAIILTVSNLPFAMETRHRVPMMDPLIAALAAGGWMRTGARWFGRRHTMHQATGEA